MPDADTNFPRHRAGVFEDLLHALNQPLTHIRCTVELMLYRPVMSDDAREKLATLLKQAERASKLSAVMQQVLEIEREHVFGQRAPLAAGMEAVLADFAPLAEQNGIVISRRMLTDCEVSASPRALGIALFLLLDQLLSCARKGDTLEIEIETKPSLAHLTCRLVTSSAATVCCDESQLLAVRSIWRAFDVQLSLRQLEHTVELCLSIPIVKGV